MITEMWQDADCYRSKASHFLLPYHFTATSNDRHGVSNYQTIVCSDYQQRNITAPSYWPFLKGIHRWLVGYPHKGPVARKMFPGGGVIMIGGILLSYYSNITWVPLRLTSSTSRLFAQLLDQVVNKENIEVRKYWAFALKTASNTESISISWRQYDLLIWFGYWIIFTSVFQSILMPLNKYNMVSIVIC